METSQMITFNDQAKNYLYANDAPYDKTMCVGDNDDANLGNFFARPIKIRDFDWGVGTTMFEQFNPWSDFFSNQRVADRIAHFNLLKCKLKVKFILNGNGFHYGRLIATYLPIQASDNFTLSRAFFTQDIIQASQRPHLYLDPTLSQGGELMLPFFFRENAMNIPETDWNQNGEIRIHTLNTLRHANGANDTVTISVFAWAEDVELSMPTSSAPGFLPQSGTGEKIDDEYGKGPISRPASVVASAAGKLTNVPYIGGYARATELAANAISGVATAFGYSRPNQIADYQHYKTQPTSNLANTNVGDLSQKLSVDCKQELTVDPATAGIMVEDELSLKSIACRESYLTQFPWVTEETPETMLWQCKVTPALWDKISVSGEPTEIHVPACGLASLPFQAWHGTMKYRFQIVASNFHKGRLKIVYDPYGFASNEYNTNYTYIHDIAENKDFTLEIGWGTHYPYCTVGMPGRVVGTSIVSEENLPFSTTPVGEAATIGANGILRVYVVNPITVPNSAAAGDVAVNVFVSAGEDIRFRNPDNILDQYTYFPGSAPSRARTAIDESERLDPQSGEEQPDIEGTTEPSKPIETEVMTTMATPTQEGGEYDKVFYGESISSFRQLLKRFNYHSSDFCMGAVLGSDVFHWTNEMLAFPYYNGYAPAAITDVTSPFPGKANLCKMTLMNLLTPCYTGWRGGIKWKKILSLPGNFRTETSVLVQRGYGPAGYNNEFDITADTAEVDALAQRQDIITSCGAGAAVTHASVMPSVEIEMPYQEQTRFTTAKTANWTGSANRPRSYFRTSTTQATSGNSIAWLDNYVAAGEDFQLFFFTGAPILYRYTSSPS